MSATTSDTEGGDEIAEQTKEEEEEKQEQLSQLLKALLRKRSLKPTTTRVSKAPVAVDSDEEEDDDTYPSADSRIDSKKKSYWTTKRKFAALVIVTYMLSGYGLINATLLSNKTYHMASWLMIRCMGMVWLLSFVSLAVQIHGLIGEDGILRLGDTISIFKANQRSIWSYPTLFWYRQDDSFIRFVYQLGIASSIMTILNIFPMINLAICYLCFISFRQVGREFFALQFDSLLLEVTSLLLLLHIRSPIAGFLHWHPSISSLNEPSHSILWCLWWLAFRLNFCSGVLKIMTGDKAWRSGKALLYHYWSQPMPSWISYYFHWYLPEKFHIFSCYMHFVIEIIVPFGMFFDSTRLLASLGLISLQVAILVTGNYGVFNWLTFMLAASGIDDSYFPSSILNLIVGGSAPTNTITAISSSSPSLSSYSNYADYILSTPLRDIMTIPNLLGLLCFAYAIMILVISYVPICLISKGTLYPSSTLYDWYSTLQNYSLLNYYGLFGSMTTFRHEVIIEASNDGQTWLPYEFLYKPGDPKKAPRWVTGHLPRLDWRMWFLPFDRSRPVTEPPATWFLLIILGFLKASPSVLGIIRSAPFGSTPPKYLRTSVWDYHFEDPQKMKTTGCWWDRTHIRPFTTIMTLENDKLLFLPATTNVPSEEPVSIQSK